MWPFWLVKMSSYHFRKISQGYRIHLPNMKRIHLMAAKLLWKENTDPRSHFSYIQTSVPRRTLNKYHNPLLFTFYCIMSDNLELPGYVVFYPWSISLFSQSVSRTHPCHITIPVLQYGKLCGCNVLLNNRQLTGNRLGSTKTWNRKKKSLPQNP